MDGGSSPGRALRKIVRLLLFIAVSLGMASLLRTTGWMPPRLWRGRYRRALQSLWAKAMWQILGLRVEVRGKCPSDGPFLVVSNHLGYLDIAVLSGILPVTFVSKAEVRDIACWHGDMEFAPHFWSFLGSGGARFRVCIGEPFCGESLDRKSIAQVAYRTIENLGKSTSSNRTLLPGNWIWVHAVL